MRSSALFAALIYAAYATPIARDGHWISENQDAGVKVAADPNPYSSVTLAVPTSPAPSSTTTVSTSTASSGAPVQPQMLGNSNAKPNPSPNPSLVASLLTSSSEASRISLLNNAENQGIFDFKFDLSPAANPEFTPGAGGEAILVDRTLFPILTDLGTAFGGLFFAPCGLNPPHFHPRATEILTLVTDGILKSGFVLDSTFNTEIYVNLTQYQGTAYPQGSIHWQLNTECTPQVAIAGFSSDDPGINHVAQRFLVNTDADIVEAALGFPEQVTPDNFAALKQNIPAPFVLGIENCYAKCGIAQ